MQPNSAPMGSVGMSMNNKERVMMD